MKIKNGKCFLTVNCFFLAYRKHDLTLLSIQTTAVLGHVLTPPTQNRGAGEGGFLGESLLINSNFELWLHSDSNVTAISLPSLLLSQITMAVTI